MIYLSLISSIDLNPILDGTYERQTELALDTRFRVFSAKTGRNYVFFFEGYKIKDSKEIIKLTESFTLESNISDTWSEFPIGSVLLHSKYKDELVMFGSLLKQRKIGGIPALKQDRKVVFEGEFMENPEEIKERFYGKKV